MIYGRLIFYMLLQVVLILGLTAGEDLIAGQYIRKCAENNEYCQTHSDCCSNSCLTYLYRCTRNYQSYPYPFLGVTYDKTVTLDDILEMNFGKEPTNFASRIGGTGNELSGEDIKVEAITKDTVTEIQRTTDSPDVVKAVTEKEPCKANGVKCYYDHECCTNRCQHFLHQCVT